MPTYEVLIALAQNMDWRLEFGYSLIAAMEYEGVDYFVGKYDWYDGRQPSPGCSWTYALVEVVHMGFSESVIRKISEIKDTRTHDSDYFFVFGLHALFSL